MKSNAELKELAWGRLWADRWFGRLFGGGLLLGFCCYAVNRALTVILTSLHVQDWTGYATAVAANRQDVTVPIPTLTQGYVYQATSATLLEFFLGWIMAGIATYGGAVILRRCLANEEDGWLRAAFGGFNAPFGMLWLFVRQALIFLGWALLSVPVLGVAIVAGIPVFKQLNSSDPLAPWVASAIAALLIGIYLAFLLVPFYRYRYLWLIKAEHPAWGAGQCLKACRELMRGNMMKSVRLDCSYWKPLMLILVLIIVFAITFGLAFTGTGNRLLTGFVCSVSFCGLIAASAVTGQYVSVGQAFLYQELKEIDAMKRREGREVRQD